MKALRGISRFSSRISALPRFVRARPLLRPVSSSSHSVFQRTPTVSATNCFNGARHSRRHNGNDANGSDVPPLDTEEIMSFVGDLEKRRKFKGVYESVVIDPRVRMPFAEFSALCANQGLDNADSEELANALSTAGLIWYFGDSRPIIIKPNTVSREFLRALDLDSVINRQWLDEKHQELASLLKEIEPLQVQYDGIEQRAENYAKNVWRLGFLYITGHCILVPYLTFWRLSWDIMEPVTYMFNLWTLFFGVWFYRKTHFEFTYESINDAILRLQKEKHFARIDFDVDLYEKLREQIAELEDDLMNPEWQALKHVHPGIPDTIKQIHLHPLGLLQQLQASDSTQQSEDESS